MTFYVNGVVERQAFGEVLVAVYGMATVINLGQDGSEERESQNSCR